MSGEIARLWATLGVNDTEHRVKMAAAESRFQSLRRTASTVTTALASVGLAVGIRELTQYADTWKLVEGRLKLVSGSTTELRTVQSELFRIAQEARTPFDQTADIYARMARNADGLNASQSQMLTVTRAISQSMAVSGASTESARAALIQLNQAFGSGVLRGEELNSVLEQAPRLAEAIATGMGVTVGELRALGEQGKLTAEEVFQALLGQSTAIEREFADMPRTVGQALTQVRNSIMRQIGEIDRSSGATAALAAGIGSIADNMRALVGAIGIAAAALTGRFLVSLGAAGAAKIQSARHSHALALAERAQAAASLDAARASEVEAAAKVRELQVTRAAIELSRQETVAALQRNQAFLSRAVPIENLRPLGHAAVERELLRRAQATQAVSAATGELAVLGQQQARINAALSGATMSVAAAAGVAEARVTALAAASARASIAQRAMAASSALMSRAMAFLTGPWGIALTALAIGFMALRKPTDDSAASMTDASEAADQLRTAYSNLSREQVTAAKTAAALAVEQTRAQIKMLELQRQAAEKGKPSTAGVAARAILPSIGASIATRLPQVRLNPEDQAAIASTEALDDAISQLNRVLEMQQGLLSGASTALDRYGEESSDAFNKIIEGLREQRAEFEGGERAAFQYSLSTRDLTDSQEAAALAEWDLTEAARRSREAREEAQRTNQQLKERVADLNQEMAIEYERLTRGEDAAYALQLATEGLSAAEVRALVTKRAVNRELAESQEREKDRLKDLAEARAKALAEELDARDRLMKAKEQEIQSVADSMAGASGDAFTDWISGTETLARSFTRMVNSMIRDIVRLAAQKAFVDPLAAALGDILKTGIGMLAPNAGGGGFIPGGVRVDGGGGLALMGAPSSALSGVRASSGTTVHVHQTIPISVQSLDALTAYDLILANQGAVAEAMISAAHSSAAVRAALRDG